MKDLTLHAIHLHGSINGDIREIMLAREGIIRLISFLGIFTLMAVWELISPRRPLIVNKPRRWFSNLTITILNTFLVRILFPTGAVGVAFAISRKGWGILSQMVLPGWIGIIVTVAALDFIIYIQHVVFHAFPILWRIHMVHHADLDIDVTTGNRFHPIEILLSMVIKIASVALIGAPPLSVLVFEVLLNATSMFNHSNVNMPKYIDRILRLIIVTPDMHCIHHSVIRHETNSNFGFNIPWWDRMFRTYRSDPAEGHKGMTLGLNQFQNPDQHTFIWMLTLPLAGDTGNYPSKGERG